MGAIRRPFSGGSWLDPAAPAFSWSQVNLVIEGDSQSDATYNTNTWGTTCWTTLLASLEPTAVIQSVALSGDQVGADMIGQGASQVDTKYNAAKTYNVELLWGGTNDLDNGVSPSTAAGFVSTWISERRTAHPSVFIVVMNMPIRAGVSEGNRNAFNAALSGVGADLLIDIATVVGTPGQGDGIHFTQAEHNSIRDAVHAALVGALS